VSERFSLDPVLRRFGTVGEAADHLGVSVRSLYRWMKDGLSWQRADEVAVRLGVHPANIWPDWFAAAVP
jgi:lambda repressor-like predicted transcriptional regulator